MRSWTRCKKAHRDHGGEFNIAAIKAELSEVLWYLGQLSYLLGLELSDVATGNITKILDRKAPGVTRGTGDNR